MDDKNHTDKSLKSYSELIAHYKQTNNPAALAMLQNNLGLLHARSKRYEEALTCFREALGLFEAQMNKVRVAEQWGNIGSVYRDLGECEKALESYRYALPIFEELGREEGVADQYTNIAYIHAMREEYRESLTWYRRALPRYQKIGNMDKTDSTSMNIHNIEKALRDERMKGLELAEQYFVIYGVAMIRAKFSEYEGRVAAGLVGPGSECFGFDDEISRDHDWGPGFCLWLDKETHAEIGDTLQQEYLNLPKVFMDFGPRIASPGEEARIGVSETCAFFRRYTGLDRTPQSPQEWMRIPEESLATCTNGKVFADPLGKFTKWREKLLQFYPEDVRLKKIASRCITIAQSGQYNFERSMKRGERFAARCAETTFCSDVISLVFLLNRRYTPFYKWRHRALLNLPILGIEMHSMINRLVETVDHREKKRVIDEIAALLIEAMRKDGLTDSSSDFLLDHAPIIHEKITDSVLRQRLHAAK